MRRMYSENQIVKILENKEVKVKTIEQQEPNWEQELQFVNPSNPDLSITNVYSRIEVFNNILYLIFNFKVKNNGSAPSSALNYVFLDTEISQEIGDKIYDFGGKKVSEAPTLGNLSITSIHAFHSTSDYPDAIGSGATVILQHIATNKIRGVYQSLPEINAGSEIAVTGRIILTLR